VITGNASPLKTLADAKGKRWVLPEQESYMSKFCAAELRDQGINILTERHQFVREQGAVVFYLDNGLADVGAVACTRAPARPWPRAATGYCIAVSPSPTSRSLPAAGLARTGPSHSSRTAGLATDRRRAWILQTIGIDAFDTDSGEPLKRLLRWLEK
jgi:hypothetical protein